jgi:hypothetical protein
MGSRAKRPDLSTVLSGCQRTLRRAAAPIENAVRGAVAIVKAVVA